MPGASGPMRGMRGNLRGRGGRGGSYISIFIFYIEIKLNIILQVFYLNRDMALVLLVMVMGVGIT